MFDDSLQSVLIRQMHMAKEPVARMQIKEQFFKTLKALMGIVLAVLSYLKVLKD